MPRLILVRGGPGAGDAAGIRCGAWQVVPAGLVTDGKSTKALEPSTTLDRSSARVARPLTATRFILSATMGRFTPVIWPSEVLKTASERRLGVAIFQEQVMQLSMSAAGLRRTGCVGQCRPGASPYFDEIRSTSNTSVAFGGITPPAPRAP